MPLLGLGETNIAFLIFPVVISAGSIPNTDGLPLDTHILSSWAASTTCTSDTNCITSCTEVYAECLRGKYNVPGS